MTRSLGRPAILALIAAVFLGAPAAAQPSQIPPLAIDDRGELQLGPDGQISYRPWRFAPLHAPARIGLFILTPARLSSRQDIAALKQAMTARDYDYTQLISTTIVNLDDATFGAGLMINGELAIDKTETPQLQLIVDEHDQARKQLELARRQIHILLHDCQGRVFFRHHGPVAETQASTIVSAIDTALGGEPCPATKGKEQ